MKKDILFAIIFLSIGFIIGFYMAAHNTLEPLVTIKHTEDEKVEEQTGKQNTEQPYGKPEYIILPQESMKGNTEKKKTSQQQKKESSEQKSSNSQTAVSNSGNIVPKSDNSVVESSNSTTNSQSFNPNALTVVSFIQDWLDTEATLSLKNNTNETIHSFKATIIYKDMNGNILDYQEINKSISIAPQMAKIVTIKPFGRANDYVYYKTQKYNPNKKRVFKIEFKLNSYQ